MALTQDAVLAGIKEIVVEVAGIDASKIEAAITARTRAILPVHLYGHMCDMRAIRDIADRNQLHIVEDCAHCVEGQRDGIKPGQLSDAACFSFYATKNLTCGEGGALVTNRDDLIEELRLLRLHGMTKMAADRQREGYKHWDMVMLGWKYNMDNIQAAILLPQMKRLGEKGAIRQKLASLYEELLSSISGVKLLSSRERTLHARHLFPVLVDATVRDGLIAELNNIGISVMVNYRAIHLLTYFAKEYGYKEGDFPVAEKIGNRIMSLPFYPTMPIDHVHRVVKAIGHLTNG